MSLRSTCNAAFLLALCVPAASRACSISHLATPAELTQQADAIVHARAVGYETAPRSKWWTTGEPDSRVRFQVLETLRGTAPSTLVLHGYLAQGDDFNDQPSPYTFVRPGGRAGSCLASTYKQNGEYLLFLKKSAQSGELTTYWGPLAPVNEQLHPGNDPWLLWTRKQIAAAGK